MWDLEGDVLEVGSRWHSAELLSCCVAGEGRTQLGEGRKELEVWQSFCFTGLWPAKEQQKAIQLGCRALCGFDPVRGSATKHPRRGETCTHRVRGSLTPLLCAGVSTLAAAPAVRQQGPWQCSLGHRFISAHANNLEVSPGVGQLVPGSAFGSILYVPM